MLRKPRYPARGMERKLLRGSGQKYNDDVLSVSFTGMAKDFRFLSYLKNGAETEKIRFLSYLKNGAETEKKLQITLTEKMVYEADELYSSIREQIYRYDTSEYLSLHEKYEDVAKGIAEIIFITPVQELSTDTLLPLLFDLERYGRYSQRKITIIDPGKVDKLPDVETALYYVHLCNLDETLFKKKKQYLEKVRSLLELRRFCSFPDTFFLCEYDNQTEEYDDINYCIDIVFKHRQFPVLPFHLKTHSFAIQEITEKFFYDYLFGERLSNYLTQVKDSFFCIEEKKQRVEDLKRQLSEIKKEREILENEKLQYQKIPKILDRELFKSAFEDDLRWYYYWHGSKIISFCTVYLYGIEYPTGTELPTTLNDRVKNFLEDLKNFFSRRDYSILHEQFCTIFPSDEEEVKLFISKFFDEWEDR